jgi:light-regulated signal transduction histidine kinase (bacteriophytochrome)
MFVRSIRWAYYYYQPHKGRVSQYGNSRFKHHSWWLSSSRANLQWFQDGGLSWGASGSAGMTEEVKAKIFDHLFTTKTVGKGTGLGLAIARQIVVDKHSGAIDVKSQPGEGTEFQIQIPLHSTSSQL